MVYYVTSTQLIAPWKEHKAFLEEGKEMRVAMRQNMALQLARLAGHSVR